MQSVLPYATTAEQMHLCENMKLLNPNSAVVTGPCISLREPKRVAGGLLQGWDADAVQNASNHATPAVTWDLSWTLSEAKWEQEVHRCMCPEEVEDLLPSKWIAYNMQADRDDTLAKVCKLCTALVDRFVELSQGDKVSASTGKWRQYQSLYERLGAVMELLEASVGDAIPILNLRNPAYIRECWETMGEEERHDVISALGIYKENVGE